MVQMSPGAWVLLAVLHRADDGGPMPREFTSEYTELCENGLATGTGPALKITAQGEAALWERAFDAD